MISPSVLKEHGIHVNKVSEREQLSAIEQLQDRASCGRIYDHVPARLPCWIQPRLQYRRVDEFCIAPLD
jgi:hypothetical protein